MHCNGAPLPADTTAPGGPRFIKVVLCHPALTLHPPPTSGSHVFSNTTHRCLMHLQWGLGDVLAQRLAEQRPVLDRHRVAMTAAFGATFMGPVGHFWYLGL